MASTSGGLYPGMSVEDYDAIPAVRHTHLKELRRSPKRALHRLAHGIKDTPQLRGGRIVHTAALEPEKLSLSYVLREHGFDRYVVWEGGDRRGKDWKDFEAAHKGIEIFKPSELEPYAKQLADAKRLGELLRADAVAGPLLRQPHREVVAVWRDEETGLWCKARMDVLGRELADLKLTSRGIESRQFGASAARLEYHQALAFYHDGLTAVGHEPEGVSLIAAEDDEPHDVVVYDLDEDQLELGRRGYQELLRHLVICQEDNSWPGYARGARLPLQLPAYVYPDEDAASDTDWGMGASNGQV